MITLQQAWIEGSTWAQSHIDCTREEYDAAVDYYHKRHSSPAVANHFRKAILNALRVAAREGRRAA